MCTCLIGLVCISAHGGCCVFIVDVHCHVRFYAIYQFIACSRKFYVVFIRVLTFSFVDHFSWLVPQDKLHSFVFPPGVEWNRFFGLPTLKQPTYSWPSERADVYILWSTTLKLCPCDLLMVIAMLSLTGNCNLFNSTGSHLHWGWEVFLEWIVIHLHIGQPWQ